MCISLHWCIRTWGIVLHVRSVHLGISFSSKGASEGGGDEDAVRARAGKSLILSPPRCLTSYVPPWIRMFMWVGVRATVRVSVCRRERGRAVYPFSTACRSWRSLPLNRWGSVLWALNSQHSGQMVRLSATLCLWVRVCVCVASGRRQEVNICQKAKRQLVV